MSSSESTRTMPRTLPEIGAVMRRLHDGFPEMRRTLKDPHRSRVIHDILLEEMSRVAVHAQPSPEVMIARLMEAGYHVTSKPRNLVSMRRPGTSQVTPADQQIVSVRPGSQRAKILMAYLAAGIEGCTDDQAARSAEVSMRSCYWKRCGELRQAGLIEPMVAGDEDIPVTREGESGTSRTVCVITPEGRAVAYGLDD